PRQHSFPTRRSSDLFGAECGGGEFALKNNFGIKRKPIISPMWPGSCSLRLSIPPQGISKALLERPRSRLKRPPVRSQKSAITTRSEEHTSELQSLAY